MSDQQPLTLNRIIFLTSLVTVFLYTYLADGQIPIFIINTLMKSCYWGFVFLISYISLSSVCLSFYYYTFHRHSATITGNLFPWLKLYILSFILGLIICAFIIYFHILGDRSFDLTPNSL